MHTRLFLEETKVKDAVQEQAQCTPAANVHSVFRARVELICVKCSCKEYGVGIKFLAPTAFFALQTPLQHIALLAKVDKASVNVRPCLILELSDDLIARFC